ncbi:hypothetical protein [uncultured Mycolicibacterium sp.]|uniref:hypothetical protein n=1 Tax=uncultured Mycolicibacterium sp. TaxID=2320817 RepID=UPI00260AFCF8|nr:hypothetical protein [uncultured Mycolicibacterium sp.]
MRLTKKLLAASVLTAGGAISIAMTFSATAAAQPAPAPAPPGPAAPSIPFMEQLAAAAANAPQLLQSAAAALSGQTAANAPAATPSVPATGGMPVSAPIVKQPATVVAPGVPNPATALTQLPAQFPGNLTNLLPTGAPALGNLAPTAPADPAAATAPVAEGGLPLQQLSPLSALP